MTTPVIDTRTYRTELEQPSACGGRWGLYVDGRLIARSPEPMGDAAARDWANSQPWGAAPHPGAPPAGGRGTRVAALPSITRPEGNHTAARAASDEAACTPDPGAVWLRPRDRRQNRSARALRGKSKTKGLGAKIAPLTRRKSKATARRGCHRGGPGAAGPGAGPFGAPLASTRPGRHAVHHEQQQRTATGQHGDQVRADDTGAATRRPRSGFGVVAVAVAVAGWVGCCGSWWCRGGCL